MADILTLPQQDSIEVPHTSVLIDAILAKRNAERDADYIPSGRISASGLAGCDRAIWYKHHRYPPLSLPTAKTHRRWHYGRLVERSVVEAHQYAGTLLAEEVHVKDEGLGIGVSGRIDAVVGGTFGPVTYPMSTVLEIKSRTAIQMKYLYREADPHDSEKLQLGTYYLIYKRAGGWVGCSAVGFRDDYRLLPEPKAWAIACVAGDSGGEMDFPMLRKWADAAEARIEELSAILTSEDEPPCTCEDLYNGKGPHYCSFAEWPAGTTEKDRDNPKLMPTTCCGRSQS